MKKRKRHSAPKIEAPALAVPPRQHFSTSQKASIILRNVVPLVGVLFFNHSARQFVLLCVFNLALGIAGIGVVGVAVSQHGKYISNADRIAGLCTLLLVGLGITVVLTALFGWVIALYIDHSEHRLFDRVLFWSLLSILLCAIAEGWQQFNHDLRAKLDATRRKQRDQPIVLFHVLSAGLIFVYTPYAFAAGALGMTLASLAITALFIFRDLHPDLVRRLGTPAGGL